MKLTDIIRRPLVTEKTSILKEQDGQSLVFQVAIDATKIEIKQAIEALLGAKVANVRTALDARQGQAPGPVLGQALGLEEGLRPAAGRPEGP